MCGRARQDWIDPFEIKGLRFYHSAATLGIGWPPDFIPYKVGIGGGLGLLDVTGAGIVYVSKAGVALEALLAGIDFGKLVRGLLGPHGITVPNTFNRTFQLLSFDEIAFELCAMGVPIRFNQKQFQPVRSRRALVVDRRCGRARGTGDACLTCARVYHSRVRAHCMRRAFS